MNTPEGIEKMKAKKRLQGSAKLSKAAESSKHRQSKSDLAVPSHRKKPHISFDRFKKLVSEGKSLIEISSMTSKHLAGFYSALLQGRISLSKEDFEKLYSSGVSLDDIAKQHDIPRQHISYLREFYGIKRKGATWQKRLKEERPLSDEAKSVLIGSLLGDGHITPLGYFSEKHGPTQVEYLEWKASFFPEITTDKSWDSRKSVDKRSGNPVYSFSFRTRAHSFLYELRHKFYTKKNGQWIKIIPEDIADLLDPLALAVWFMDDGSTDWGWRKGKKRWENSKPSCKISTESFGYAMNYRLKKALSDKFGVSVVITDRKGSTGKDHCYLRINTDDTKKVLSIIEGIDIPSMRYKTREEEYIAKLEINPKNVFEAFSKKYQIGFIG